MLNSNELVGGAKLLQSISFCFIKTAAKTNESVNPFLIWARSLAWLGLSKVISGKLTFISNVVR